MIDTKTITGSRWPLGIALAVVAAVWIGGCVWSFEEQTAFAEWKGFHLPELLPVVIDGLAIAMAAVAFAAALDSRPAVLARLGIAFSVALSAASNAAWAWERSKGDPGTIALAVTVPVLANIAFEVLLSELRRQVLRHRGQPAPVALPYPRLARLILAPFSTVSVWRRLVLEVTDPVRQFAAVRAASEGTGTPAVPGPVAVSAPVLAAVPTPLPNPAVTVPPTRPNPLPTPTPEPPVGAAQNGSGTPGRNPSNGADTPATQPRSEPLGNDAETAPAPRVTRIIGTPKRTGTPNGSVTPEPPVTSDGTPAGTPGDEPLLAVLRDPTRVSRESDGTVPVKRAMRVLNIGRDRAIRLLDTAGLRRNPDPDDGADTPNGTGTGTPDDDDSERHPAPRINGHDTPHLAGVK